MKDIRRVIRLNQQSGLSTRQIAKALNISRSTISDYLQRYKQSGLELANLDGLNDSQIYASLFPVKADAEKKHQKPLPDFSKIHTELKRRYMTRQLLWEEYRQAYPDGYGYTPRYIGVSCIRIGPKVSLYPCVRFTKPVKRCLLIIPD